MRKPSPLWRDDGTPSEDGGGWELSFAMMLASVCSDGVDAWRWEIVDDGDGILAQGKAATCNEGRFAAEDAARAILLSGLAALPCEMPEGYAVESSVVGMSLDGGAAGRVSFDAAQVEALACGMLAAVRSKL